METRQDDECWNCGVPATSRTLFAAGQRYHCSGCDVLWNTLKADWSLYSEQRELEYKWNSACISWGAGPAVDFTQSNESCP